MDSYYAVDSNLVVEHNKTDLGDWVKIRHLATDPKKGELNLIMDRVKALHRILDDIIKKSVA